MVEVDQDLEEEDPEEEDLRGNSDLHWDLQFLDEMAYPHYHLDCVCLYLPSPFQNSLDHYWDHQNLWAVVVVGGDRCCRESLARSARGHHSYVDCLFLLQIYPVLRIYRDLQICRDRQIYRLHVRHGLQIYHLLSL